jgi:hypothetical protein
MSNAPIPRKSLRAKVQEHRAHNRRGLGLRAFASGFRPFAAVDGADGGDPHSGNLRQIGKGDFGLSPGHGRRREATDIHRASGRPTASSGATSANELRKKEPLREARVRQSLQRRNDWRLGIASGYHERIAAVRRFDYGPNAFVQRRETSVQSSLRESSSRNSVGVRKSQTVHHSAHRPPGRLRRSLSAFAR